MDGKIYGLFCECSGDIRYVGLTTKPLLVRLKQHLENMRSSEETHKLKWMRKHTRLGHSIQIRELESCAVDVINERERHWIDHGLAKGWNLTNGLAYDWTPASEETRAKLSAAQTERHRRNPPKTGVFKHSPETIEWMRAFQKKNAASRAGQPGTMLGKNMSEESKAKISAALTGRKRPPRSPEWSKKIGDAQRGRTLSDEQRAKISEAHRTRVRSDEELAARTAAALLTNHRRWHEARGIVKDGCVHCVTPVE